MCTMNVYLLRQVEGVGHGVHQWSDPMTTPSDGTDVYEDIQ